MEYLRVSETLEEIEQTLSFKYKDSQPSLQKTSSFPVLKRHKLNSSLNTQLYINQTKLELIEKLKNELDTLKKSPGLDKRLENLQFQLENIEEKSKSLKKSNKEYEFVKNRVAREKTELKKKLQILQNSYDKVLAAYPKVLISKDHAYTNLNYIKQNLDEYEKEKKLLNLIQTKELKEKQRLKDRYSEKSKELIHKIGSIVYKEKVHQAQLIDTFEERQKVLTEIEEINKKNKEIRKLQENTSNSLSALNEIFIQRSIPIFHSPLESILSFLKLFKEEEYSSISLSLKFNDLSNTILSKKRICNKLKSELDSFSNKSCLKNDDIELLASFKVHKDFQAESHLCQIYAQIFSFTSNIFGKLKTIEENSPDHLKKTLPGMDFSNNVNSNSQNTSRICKKRSMNFFQKTKTIAKSKTIRDTHTKATFVDKNLQFSQNFNLSDAFHHYKLVSREDLQYFLTNPVVLLCLKPGDALGVLKNPSGNSDLIKLYQLSHSNMRYFIQRLIEKLIDALINAKETIPESFIPNQRYEYLDTDLKFAKSKPKIKFSAESSKGFEGKSTDIIKRSEQKRLKFYSESSTPINTTTNMTATLKEMWSVSKRLRIVESSEKKALVSNKIIRSEINKFKSALPSLY